MPRFILQQPDGKLAIFSEIIDDFVLENATEEEVVSFFAEEAKREAAELAKAKISHLTRGRIDPIPYEDALNIAKKQRRER